MNRLAAFVVIALAACGGGGGSVTPVLGIPVVSAPAPTAPGYTYRLLVQPGDAVVPLPAGYTHSMQSNENPDAAASVAEQSQQAGTLILTVGDTRNQGFRQGDVYLREVAKYPQFTHVYLYDELFHTPEGNRIGLNEEAVNVAARMVRSVGLKTAISITPGVILDPDFKLADANAYDVIAVDVYPAAHTGTSTQGCVYNDNPYTTMLYCAAARLRSIGFRGEVWYAYQAFGINGMDKAEQNRLLSLQCGAIDEAPRFGVSGLAPFGLYLSKAQLEREPNLYQGAGSDIENLVSTCNP